MPDEKRTIGYICPVCGKAVIVERTAFQLAAGDSVLDRKSTRLNSSHS